VVTSHNSFGRKLRLSPKFSQNRGTKSNNEDEKKMDGENIILYFTIFAALFIISELKGGFNRTMGHSIPISEMIPYIPIIAILSLILVSIINYEKRKREKTNKEE